MAWFQNLAGHAEDLLNKIDQNAATVLNEGNKLISEENEHGYVNNGDKNLARVSSEEVIRNINNEQIQDNSLPEIDPVVNSEVIVTNISEDENPGILDESPVAEVKTIKNDNASVSSSSMHNSFTETKEIEDLHLKVARLELENHEVTKELLNIQHLYLEMRNENANLHSQIERINEQLIQSQKEKEQYVIRAQRILQEKEKLIELKQTNNSGEQGRNIFETYNEELKKELEFLKDKVAELNKKNENMLNDMHSQQMQHQVIQNRMAQSNQLLEQSLLTEKKNHFLTEEDCAQKTKELQNRYDELRQLQNVIKIKNEEIDKLKENYSRVSNTLSHEEYENRLKSLTQTIISKQNALETITTERNALRVQLEKLQIEHERKITQLKNDKVNVINIQEFNEEKSYMSNFLRVTPHDAAVTRRVKHAYSTLDALSVRTGIFLRRYPVARVFVFLYIVIVHIWVLTILLWYVPSNQ
ncbi:golgin-84 [Sitophilus oryzae]|uniref:Golgin-84 n=1 Tax=Sitophilus oryzae TaxID=7048 RepID=A0A6J2XB26_SITOR|nr:golgin-84 [Sitophilus oryzae]